MKLARLEGSTKRFSKRAPTLAGSSAKKASSGIAHALDQFWQHPQSRRIGAEASRKPVIATAKPSFVRGRDSDAGWDIQLPNKTSPAISLRRRHQAPLQSEMPRWR
jgi:hypothetical protein